MGSGKVTITLPLAQIEEIRSRVKRGGWVTSVSAFVQNAVTKALENDSEFQKWLNEALEETGGPLTQKERDWAKSMLESNENKRQPKKRKAA